MANDSGRTALGRKAVAPLLAIGVLAGGAHLWLNTNVLGPEEVCGGLVSTDSAAAVFLSSGRVSDQDGLDARPDDRVAFTCTVAVLIIALVRLLILRLDPHEIEVLQHVQR